MNNYWFYKGMGAAFVGLAIVVGAFGAHGLKSLLSASELQVWETANYYLALQGMAMLIVSFFPQSAKIKLTLKLFLAGTIIFSGSLMLLIATGIKLFGAITPIGGVSLILGWAVLTWHCIKQEQIKRT